MKSQMNMEECCESRICKCYVNISDQHSSLHVDTNGTVKKPGCTTQILVSLFNLLTKLQLIHLGLIRMILCNLS